MLWIFGGSGGFAAVSSQFQTILMKSLGCKSFFWPSYPLTSQEQVLNLTASAPLMHGIFYSQNFFLSNLGFKNSSKLVRYQVDKMAF